MDGQRSFVQHIADMNSHLVRFDSIDNLAAGAVLVHNSPFIRMNEFIALRDEIRIFIGYPCFTIGTVYFMYLFVNGAERIGDPIGILFVTNIAIKLINGSFHEITRINICNSERNYARWELLKRKQEP